MAKLSLLYREPGASFDKVLGKIGFKKKTMPPVMEVVIDEGTDEERSFTLQAQEEAHLIDVTPGQHVVSVYDPDRVKHVESAAKQGGFVSGLTGFALGAALGGSARTVEVITEGTAKALVGDVEKRWRKAFERHSVKEFEVQEGETVCFNCELDSERGIVRLDTMRATERKAFWLELLGGLWIATALTCMLGLELGLDDLSGILLIAAVDAIVVFVVLWRKQKKKSRAE